MGCYSKRSGNNHTLQSEFKTSFGHGEGIVNLAILVANGEERKIGKTRYVAQVCTYGCVR